MKRLLPILIVLAFVPSHAQALDTSGLRSLCAMPLAVDACARTGRVAPDQLGRFASRLNDANVPPPLFVETVRYAPVVVQQPDFFPFVDSEISQGVVGDALVTVIEQRVRGYGYDVRRGNGTPAWVLSDNYIPRFDSYRTTSRTTTYDTRYDNAPRYDRRTILYLIEMPLAVANVSDYGVPQDRLARFCGTLNRGYLPPEQFVDTVRYAPQVIVERPDFVPFLETQIGNGFTGRRLFDVIHPQLPAYQAPRVAYSPSYVLTDQYVPQNVRTRYGRTRVNPGFAQQPAFIPQPISQQQPVYRRPIYVQPQPSYVQPQPSYVQPQPSYVQPQPEQRYRRQPPPAIVRAAPQPVVIQSPQVVQQAPRAVWIPPGQAKKEERQAQGQVHDQGHGRGRERAVVQQQQPPRVVVAPPPPMASAAPPAPVMVAPPPQDNGHGHGKDQGGQGPPGQQKDKEKDKGGKGHGKD